MKLIYLSGGENSSELSKQSSLSLVCSATPEFIFGGIPSQHRFFNRYWLYVQKTIASGKFQLLESLVTIRDIPLVLNLIGQYYIYFEMAGNQEIDCAATVVIWYIRSALLCFLKINASLETNDQLKIEKSLLISPDKFAYIINFCLLLIDEWIHILN